MLWRLAAAGLVGIGIAAGRRIQDFLLGPDEPFEYTSRTSV